MYSSKKTTPGILHFVKGKKIPEKQKTNKKQKPSKIPRESEQKNMFSNLKWSRVFSSSWTSTAVWCQQNWAEACGLWARCCCGVTTPRWLWMGCAGQTTVQTHWLFAPGLRPCPKLKRQLLYPVPRCTFCSVSHLGWGQTTINVQVGKDISCFYLAR